MTAEAAFSATHKSPKGDLYTLRGDTYQEFKANIQQLLGPDADAFLNQFETAFRVNAPAGEREAVGNVIAAFPGAQVSTVGQPLPQPGYAQPAAPPPGAENVPACAHGPRVFNDKPTKNGAWRRYECALPWKPGAENRDYNNSRCKAINA